MDRWISSSRRVVLQLRPTLMSSPAEIRYKSLPYGLGISFNQYLMRSDIRRANKNIAAI
jgi:hypothetical protein